MSLEGKLQFEQQIKTMADRQLLECVALQVYEWPAKCEAEMKRIEEVNLARQALEDRVLILEGQSKRAVKMGAGVGVGVTGVILGLAEGIKLIFGK
jgi:hypothetical protein